MDVFNAAVGILCNSIVSYSRRYKLRETDAVLVG